MNDLLTLIEASVTAQVVLVTVLGLLIGSFLNVVILRYPIIPGYSARPSRVPDT